MKIPVVSYFTIVVLFVAMSCSDKDDPKTTFESALIRACHDKQTWGLDEVQDHLIGQWDWKDAEYIYATPPDIDLTGMKIEFRDDMTGTLTYSKIAPQQFTWSIGTYNTYYSFTTEPVIQQLSGQILFCDDTMLCGIEGSGIADGVNNFYQKVK